MLRDRYQMAASSPAMPDTIAGDGLLVGWSIEHDHMRRPMGFSFGDAITSNDPALVDPILFGDEGHLLTIASTGAGKGVGCIIPALLTHKGPMIVIDPKGENAAVTRRYREEGLGQAVHVIDPMDIVDGPSAALNPLDMIDVSDRNCVDEAAALADLLSEHTKADDRNQYWHNRGRHLLTALILHAASSDDPAERTLFQVRQWLGMGFETKADMVLDSGNPLYKMMSTSRHSAVREAASAVRSLADTTLGSIISTASDMVDFVRGLPVREATQTSSFSLDAITRGDPITIYIVLPPHMLESHSQLLRLWVGTLLKAIMRRRYRVQRPTMLLLDEAAQLGAFPPLRQAITLMRGYGLQTWSFWQDVDQLRHCYPTSWRTLINNCRAVQAFGAPNMSAAASIAELFMLINPARILDLDRDEMVVQLAGDDAFIAQRPNYLTDPAFAGRFDPNPFYIEAPGPLETQRVRRRESAYLRDPQPPEDLADDAGSAQHDRARLRKLVAQWDEE